MIDTAPFVPLVAILAVAGSLVAIVLWRINRDLRELRIPFTDFEVIRDGFEAQLAPDEYYCISTPDGPLPHTISKIVGEPIRIICEKTGHDWADLVESKLFRLRKVKVTPEELAEIRAEIAKEEEALANGR